MAATITSNGCFVVQISALNDDSDFYLSVCNRLVGDIIPSNLVEIVFTIVLMIFNLTLFRCISAIVVW